MSDEKISMEGLEQEEKQKSAGIFSFLISFLVFLFIVILPLYFLLYSGLVYVPKLSDAILDKNEVYNKKQVVLTDLFKRIKIKDDLWTLKLEEYELNYLLDSYFAKDWGVDLKKNELIIKGPMFNAINNKDAKIYLSLDLIKVQDNYDLDIYISKFAVPEFMENYLLKKFLKIDSDTEKDEKKDYKEYFEDVEFYDDYILVKGNKIELFDLKNHFNFDNLKKILLDYFIENYNKK